MKTILVSGGTEGIGKAIVWKLLEEGNSVVTFSVNKEKCQNLESELKKNFNETNFLVLQGDVSSESDRQRIVKESYAKFSEINCLVNNAGIALFGTYDEFPNEKIEKLIGINLTGLMLLTKLVLPKMQEKKSGHIVNIASTSGKQADPMTEYYNASKFGLMGYSDGLRKELKNSKIKVSTVCPGVVETPLIENLVKGKPELNQVLSQMGSLQPEDIANAVNYILNQPENCVVEDITITPLN